MLIDDVKEGDGDGEIEYHKDYNDKDDDDSNKDERYWLQMSCCSFFPQHLERLTPFRFMRYLSGQNETVLLCGLCDVIKYSYVHSRTFDSL